MPIKKILKNENKKPKSNKPSTNFRPIVLLLLLSLLIALILPYLKEKQTFIDNNIALNQLEQKFSEGAYEEILIDNNKAIATLS
jgi:hypothetical protein